MWKSIAFKMYECWSRLIFGFGLWLTIILISLSYVIRRKTARPPLRRVRSAGRKTGWYKGGKKSPE